MATEHNDAITSRRSAMTSFLATSAALLTATSSPPEANAAESRTIARLSGSGLVFKDTLVVESFDDPKVKGVTLYVSNFERPLTERVQKDFFTEPSYASVTCVKTGPIELADNIDKSDKGEVSLISYFIWHCFSIYEQHVYMITHCIHHYKHSLSLKRNDHCYLKKYVSNEFMIKRRTLLFTFRSILDLIRTPIRIIVGLRVQFVPFH